MRMKAAPLPAQAAGVSIDADRVLSGGVAKAIRLMRDNLTLELGVSAIAIAVGVSERTLRRQFHCFTGQSPAAFHRNLRLEAARQALRVGQAGLNVTAAAVGHGFGHFGRFAARYRRRFGELPSNTLRTARTPLATSPP